MKKIILTAIMIGASIEATIRWFRATSPEIGVPGWGWARPLTGAVLAIAAAAAISTIGGWLIEKWAKTLDEAAEGIELGELGQALWGLAATVAAPVILWWGLYL